MSMGLVAYGASSDEESSNEDCENNSAIKENTDDFVSVKKREFTENKNAACLGESSSSNEEHYAESIQTSFMNGKNVLLQKTHQIPFANLPLPKLSTADEIDEEDDEFLRKKEMPPAVEKCASKKGTVKILIPSLSEFNDIRDSKREGGTPNVGPSPKLCGLLDLLPKPRHERIFSKDHPSESRNNEIKKSLIPDSIKNRQVATGGNLLNVAKAHARKTLVPSFDDSGDSNSDDDFFSLNTKQELPEVSPHEINCMVAKKAAEMADVAGKFGEKISQEDTVETALESEENEEKEDVQFDEKALQVLVGSRAKRRKVEVNIVELSSEQVLPNKGEWLRTALAQATSYQPKGVLVDEEPAPGTRKKHQITYLAHQAKANEQELQAMWSANRHTRRQTQSKYGF